ALDQVQMRVYLVRPIDGYVKDAGLPQRQQGDLFLLSQDSRLLGRWYSIDMQVSLPNSLAERFDKGSCSTTGTETDAGAIRYKLKGPFDDRHGRTPSRWRLTGTPRRRTPFSSPWQPLESSPR